MSVDRVAVVGAGTMGRGIALTYALGGRAVALYDVDAAALDAAEDRIEADADTLVDAGARTRAEADAALRRIGYREGLEAAVAGADLVTEAVPEAMELKRETFRELDRVAPGDAILASNTSGLSITALSEEVGRPGRVCGTHWFNPAHIVPLVEVVRGEHTDDATVEAAYGLLEAVGKTPVEVERDVPGFIGNRLQLAMTYEAFSLLDRGVASAEAIDRAVKAGFGFRLPILGVFERADHGGLDVHHAVEEYLLPDLDRGTEPPESLSRLVEAGELGLKTGRGIYEWDRPADEVYAERDRRLLAMRSVYDAGGPED